MAVQVDSNTEQSVEQSEQLLAWSSPPSQRCSKNNHVGQNNRNRIVNNPDYSITIILKILLLYDYLITIILKVL